MRVACLQMTSTGDVEPNLAYVDQQLKLAAEKSVDMLLLPENFAQMPRSATEQHFEQQGSGPVQSFLAAKSKQYQIAIVAGSVAIREQGEQQPHARSLVYDVTGELIVSYNKIHLFDVTVPQGDGQKSQSYKESDTYVAGNTAAENLVVTEVQGASIGLSICYDLRFPEMYRQLTNLGAQIIVVPAAFTYDTGSAHWRTLLRARAIENQVFVMAAAQAGQHENGRRTWGHSVIIDPWGEIVAEFTDAEQLTGLLIADLDLNKLSEVRNNFPALTHRRL